MGLETECLRKMEEKLLQIVGLKGEKSFVLSFLYNKLNISEY